MRKAAMVLLVALFAVAGVFAGGAKEGSGDVYKIGFIGPLTGDNANYGIRCSNAARLAIDEINAAGGVEGKDVLVVGAGRVGSWATRILLDWGANVQVTDIDYSKAEALIPLGAKAIRGVENAISDNTLLINAAPYIIPGEIIAQGSIISSPGVPHYYDLEGRTRCKAIIHDPLEIGAAVMAVNSAAYTIKKEMRA